jgi:serine-type D-Ala-D-Ala carboxypeptidase (penicillin-binding protein 5/6)
MLSSLLLPASVFATELPQMDTKSHILMDYQSGEILEEDNAKTPKPPASMTKMMSAIIIFEHIKQMRLKWDEDVTTSERAAAINEAEIRLEHGEKQTVKELVIAMFVESANDATVALAEHVAGSEEAFVQLMNQKAKELGLQHTHFQNSTGLNTDSYPDPPQENGNGQHVMSAQDAALIAQHLLKNYPEVLEYSSIPNYTFNQGTSREQNSNNWDLMLPTLRYTYQGVDGLKTGHTNDAGYCFTGTAMRNGFRVISVVMGTTSEYARFHETKKLLDYAYDNYQIKTAWTAGQPIAGYANLAVPNGVERTIPIAPKSTLQLPKLKDQLHAYSYHVVFHKGLKAPLGKGVEVGKVELTYQGKPISGVQSVPLVTIKQMDQGSFLRLFSRKVWDEVNSWLN